MSTREKDLHANALRLLTRREYSAKELMEKLTQQGFDACEIDAELAVLQAMDWQSDQRFVEAFIRYRQQQGKGPLRIKQELKQRGISDELIKNYLNEQDAIWLELASRARCKKADRQDIKDAKQRAKVVRYLQYLGFHYDQIKTVINIEENEHDIT